MTTSEMASPFHHGEQAVQARMGVREHAEALGSQFIRNYLPEQHSDFYARLPYLLVGSIDDQGRPWASILAGRPGFLSSPEPSTLTMNTRPFFGDPLNENLHKGIQLGMLGIEYHSRRRNRLSGKVTDVDDKKIEITVDQAFGNCPQYIQAREFEVLPGVDNIGEEKPLGKFNQLDERAKAIISKADNFYIASHFSDSEKDVRHGADISHRGGKPGFVAIEDDLTLKFPDFRGNNHFNTLGNIELNPRAGLLFVDFDNGDLLYLTVSAEIIWDSSEGRDFDGAERIVKFTLDEGRLIEGAMPVRWKQVEYSPSLQRTGSWNELKLKQAALKEKTAYQDYRVVKVEDESELIKSFYLQPADGSKLQPHQAGQFLPVQITLPGETKSIQGSYQRTYTISNAANGEYYRLSIKKEAARESGMAPGLSSNYFHDHVVAGSIIKAMSPRGKFVLEEQSSRPIVLISGGVGITPMISMVQALYAQRNAGADARKIWFLHAAQNSKVHAFNNYIHELAKDWENLTLHTTYSNPLAEDAAGVDYDTNGYIDIELLKSLLPLDDYDFYYCGPPPFMDGLYQGLKSLNINDARIHYEFFGPATAPAKSAPLNTAASSDLAKQKKENISTPVPVKFARSGIETMWQPAKGSLLELAESAGIQPLYSCRSGICGTCSTKVVAGEVSYLEALADEPAAGEALICCSIPKAQVNTNANNSLILNL